MSSCSPSKISQSINDEWRACDRNGKQYLRKILVKNILPLDFVKYISYSKVQKNRKFVNV